MRLKEIARITQGELIGADCEVAGFSIDTRTLKAAQCYVAILGEQLNGHLFVQEAIKKGASSLILSERVDADISYVLVPDTVEALGVLGAHHRAQFSCPVAALTGSCGKTTVKEMIASILPKSAFATQGNFNNHIGVPLSLLALEKTHSYGVFELGANHIGEIKRTVNWVKPDVALITNIQPAHLDGFGSIEGVAKAKAEIFESLNASGTAIINMDDERIVEKVSSLKKSMLRFSFDNPNADIYSKELVFSDEGKAQFILSLAGKDIPICLSVPGRHNVMNALSAAAVCHALGIESEAIKNGLAAFQGVAGRMTEKQGAFGTRIIDDTYNANLASVKAAIDVLAVHQGCRVLVLGELAEVECERDVHYEEIAKYAKKRNIDLLLTCGELSSQLFGAFQKEQKHFRDKTQLIAAIKPLLKSGTAILVKGSRSARMEEVVSALL